MPERIFDRQGRPISARRWGELTQDPGYRILAQIVVADVKVITVWRGVDFGPCDPPLIFEGLIFWGGDDRHALSCRRFATEATAIAGHDQLVAAVRETLTQDA